jgi:hypothetical protein
MPNANWSNPTLTSTYTNFVTEVKNRDEDLALQFDGTTSTNLVTNTIRWDSSANRWKKWNGSSWAELTATYALTALSTTGNASIGGTLGVTGGATLSSTLGVTGAITGSSTVSGTALIPTAATVPTNGLYLPAANTVALAAAGTGRLFVDSTGRVGIGTGSPTSNLSVGIGSNLLIATQAGITTAVSIVGGGYNSQNNAALILSGGQANDNRVNSWAIQALAIGTDNLGVNDLRFCTGAYSGTAYGLTERLRIDSSGRLLVGTSSAANNFRLGQKVSIVGVGGGAVDHTGLGIIGYHTTTAGVGPFLDFSRSRGATDGAMTVVQANDVLGYLTYRGADGTSFLEAARIDAYVDGTPGANDMPGRLVFSTTADGASGPTERMRISSTGAISTVVPSGSTLYPAFSARAWVNFNGTGTVAIRASGNVSSITDGGVGTYTVNFTTAMPDTDFAASVTSRRTNAADINFAATLRPTATAGTNYPLTTSSCQIWTGTVTNATLIDVDICCVAIFR